MNLTHEEFQKARRISRAIQDHLEQINRDDLRSTDLYPILAKKKLIERDKSNGVHFRRFLRKLMDNNLLKLIPQCKFKHSEGNSGFIEWHFYRVKTTENDTANINKGRKIVVPKISEEEINDLIEKTKVHIERLPKKDPKLFSQPQLDTRKMYERAYETWTEREIEIMHRAYKKFDRIDKVAELLKRQPSVVNKKLSE